MNAFHHNVHRLDLPPPERTPRFGALRNAGKLISQSVSAWIDDDAQSMGAAIAYYTIFSIAPLLVIVIAIVGRIFGADAVHGEVANQLQDLIGKDAALAVQALIAEAAQPAQNAIAASIGALLLIFGATTVFAEVQTALDRIWQVPPSPTERGWLRLVRTRLLSFGLVLALGFLLLVSLLFSVAVAALGTWWSARMGGWETILQLLNLLVSLLVTTGLFAMIYKLMPRARIAWRDVWIGAAVTALMFEIGKLLIALYVGKSGIASTFGAAGSLAVVLVWVYYSAQIFLLGAEFTWVYAHHGGSRAGQTLPVALRDGESQQPSPAM